LTGNTKTESAALGTVINPATGVALAQTFDARNRLKTVQVGSNAADTVSYQVNALGQRIQKTGAGQFAYNSSDVLTPSTRLSPQAITLAYNARYVYDEQGRLLGEYSPEGKLIAETIWFDDLPVATIRPKGSSIQLPLGIAGTGATTANNTGANSSADRVNVDVFYLHPDHLGTPRVATRSQAVNEATTGPNAINKAVWRWESDPFGTSLGNSKPNENPQNVTGTASQITAASFRVNNRFPGQVADAESGKYYNYFRDYDSNVGRYVESDPIGLRGGPSTFGYSGGKPISHFDSTGLATYVCTKPLQVCDQNGRRCWKDFRGNPFFHQYSCVIDQTGQITCGGQDRSGSALRSPGRPSSDSFLADKCEKKKDDDDCFEKCLKNEWKKPRPDYGIPFGTDCQEYDDGVRLWCSVKCDRCALRGGAWCSMN